MDCIILIPGLVLEFEKIISIGGGGDEASTIGHLLLLLFLTIISV